MKKRLNSITLVGLLLLLFAGLTIAFLSQQVMATSMDESPTGDIDGDGFLNFYEGEGVFISEINETIYPDPLLADLFVFFEKPVLQSQLPEDPFEFIRQGYSNSMLVHDLIVAVRPYHDQVLTPEQNALLLIIDSDSSDGDLGASQIGYPAYSDGIQGRVFINRIRDDVEKACSLQIPEECTAVDSDGIPYLDSDGNEIKGIEAITKLFIKNVIAHETFHMLGRVVPADRKVDYHYAQLGYIMDHHVYYKEYRKEYKVRWFISNKWAEMDIPRFK